MNDSFMIGIMLAALGMIILIVGLSNDKVRHTIAGVITAFVGFLAIMLGMKTRQADKLKKDNEKLKDRAENAEENIMKVKEFVDGIKEIDRETEEKKSAISKGPVNGDVDAIVSRLNGMQDKRSSDK